MKECKDGLKVDNLLKTNNHIITGKSKNNVFVSWEAENTSDKSQYDLVIKSLRKCRAEKGTSMK